MKGARIFENPERPDMFIKWIETSHQEQNTHQFLNEMFRGMRNSQVYSFKRLSMKLQFEILTIGLKNCTIYLAEQLKTGQFTTYEEYINNIPDRVKGPYFHFASFFVDDKENLKDILRQLGELTDDEERIKEELFMLLSYFILSFEYREDRIKNILVRNLGNLVTLITEFRDKAEDQDTVELLDTILVKLSEINQESEQAE